MGLLRHPLSDLFVFTCDTCGRQLHVDSDMSIGASAAATRAGWTVATQVTCRDCPPPAPTRRSRP